MELTVIQKNKIIEIEKVKLDKEIEVLKERIAQERHRSHIVKLNKKSSGIKM